MTPSTTLPTPFPKLHLIWYFDIYLHIHFQPPQQSRTEKGRKLFILRAHKNTNNYFKKRKLGFHWKIFKCDGFSQENWKNYNFHVTLCKVDKNSISNWENFEKAATWIGIYIQGVASIGARPSNQWLCNTSWVDVYVFAQFPNCRGWIMLLKLNIYNFLLKSLISSGVFQQLSTHKFLLD